jgi:methyltransferase
VNAGAQETGLPDASYDVVVGEAMLTMQTDKHKLEIMQEAARILRTGGYYAIHELSLTPNYLRPEVQEEIQKDLARSIRVNARPLTVAEWTRIAEEAGFEVLDVYQTEMALLEPKRMIADEGIGGVAKIMFNLARKPQIRERVLGMRSVFRRHADHMGAIGLILRKK